jgi:hypothetical protein
MAEAATPATLESVWNDYKDWDRVAGAAQAGTRFWQLLVLGFSVSGAVLGTASGVLSKFVSTSECPDALVYLDLIRIGGRDYSLLGILGAACLASAAYLSKEILGGSRQGEWIRARAAAEALKSAAYRFATGASPYDGREAERLLHDQSRQITDSVSKVLVVPELSMRNDESPPSPGMSPDAYLRERVLNQIEPDEGYYWRAVRKNDRLVKLFRRVGLGLAWLSALLGIFVALGESSVAPWIAVITTVSGTVAAYFQAGRYEDLAMSYAATARQLAHAVGAWKIANRSAAPGATLAALAAECETIMAAENQSWMAQWLEDFQNAAAEEEAGGPGDSTT